MCFIAFEGTAGDYVFVLLFQPTSVGWPCETLEDPDPRMGHGRKRNVPGGRSLNQVLFTCGFNIYFS